MIEIRWRRQRTSGGLRPGYRVYFTQRGQTLIVLLCGGDKRQQDRDIALAKRMARDLKEGI